MAEPASLMSFINQRLLAPLIFGVSSVSGLGLSMPKKWRRGANPRGARMNRTPNGEVDSFSKSDPSADRKAVLVCNAPL